MKCAICGEQIKSHYAQLMVYDKDIDEITSTCLKHELSSEQIEIINIYSSNKNRRIYENNHIKVIKQSLEKDNIVFSNIFYPSRYKIIGKLSEDFDFLVSFSNINCINSKINIEDNSLVVIECTEPIEIWKIHKSIRMRNNVKVLVISTF